MTVTYADRLKEHLGDYGETLLQVLEDVTKENKQISLSVYAERRI
jgi:hypothetical protein